MIQKNKKAWLRIVEAVIAGMMIMAVLLVIISKQSNTNDIEDEMLKIQSHILDQVRENEELRNNVLKGNLTKVEIIVNDFLPIGYNYSIKNCSLSEICNLDFYLEREVYVEDTIIAGNLTEYNPVLLKLFFWRN